MDKTKCSGCKQLKAKNGQCIDCSSILCKKCLSDHKCKNFKGHYDRL